MDFVQKVNKLREQILQTREEIEWVATAPVPREDFKAQVLRWVDAMAAKAVEAESSLFALRSCQPALLSVADPFRMQTSVSITGERPNVVPVKFSLSPMLAWAFGDLIKASLLAKVDAMDYVPGLPLAERPQRLKHLKEQLLQLEEKEEALICQAEAARVQIYRRADINPAVVLSYRAGADDEQVDQTMMTGDLYQD